MKMFKETAKAKIQVEFNKYEIYEVRKYKSGLITDKYYPLKMFSKTMIGFQHQLELQGYKRK